MPTECRECGPRARLADLFDQIREDADGYCVLLGALSINRSASKDRNYNLVCRLTIHQFHRCLLEAPGKSEVTLLGDARYVPL